MLSLSAQTPMVIDGYVRLSRDDNKRNYSSIENQKKIIHAYASENNMVVRHIYEDDGLSGYSFDRPAFQRMMADLDQIQVIAAKDLSRIGRHNAKVLLFLEEMERLGKRVILIDDQYDSLFSDDDMIGIKTWDNERHVKHTSRKVRRIKRIEQENGTLICLPPFGYTRHPLNKQMVLIDEEAASILRLEKDLYLEGNGIRKVAEILSRREVPTPSMLEKERYEALGLPYRRKIATLWSYGMVKDTLFNDYHNGIFRTHKRERASINGKDKKIPKDQQFVFPGHHPKIFDDDTVRLLHQIKDSRHHSHYRGQRKHRNLFSGCLRCSDCGAKLTAINRPGRKKYYVCGTYNKKGKRFCPSAHQVTEEALLDALTHYLALCRDALAPAIAGFDLGVLEEASYSSDHKCLRLESKLARSKAELKTLISQRIRELTLHPCDGQLIAQTYDSLQEEAMNRILSMEAELKTLNKEAVLKTPKREADLQTPKKETDLQTLKKEADLQTLKKETDLQTLKKEADLQTPKKETDLQALKKEAGPLEILGEILEQKSLTRADIEILVETIIVGPDGSMDLHLKCGLGRPSSHGPAPKQVPCAGEGGGNAGNGV